MTWGGRLSSTRVKYRNQGERASVILIKLRDPPSTLCDGKPSHLMDPHQQTSNSVHRGQEGNTPGGRSGLAGVLVHQDCQGFVFQKLYSYASYSTNVKFICSRRVRRICETCGVNFAITAFLGTKYHGWPPTFKFRVRLTSMYCHLAKTLNPPSAPSQTGRGRSVKRAESVLTRRN